jgi:hypothetical protein
MFHLVARSADGRLLFRTWSEGLALWQRVVRRVPGIVAFTVMPDHLHLVHLDDVRQPLAQILAGYARWRNRARGERGRVFEPLPTAQLLTDEDKRRRAVRYVHLNPCRARLVRDPLAWPLSTHRDAVGLAAVPIVRVRRDVAAFHAFVSGDPSVAPGGTPLPVPTARTDDLDAVLAAVSALTRTPLDELGHRSAARTLYLRAVADLCPELPRVEAAARVGAARSTAFAAKASPADRLVARVVHDPRFAALARGDLREAPGWERYRGRP